MRTTTEGKVLKTSKLQRPIYQIAREIRDDWKPVSPHAKPYLDAMFSLNNIKNKRNEKNGNLLPKQHRPSLGYF